MFFHRLIQRVKLYGVTVARNHEHRFKQWTIPSSESLIVGTLANVARNKHVKVKISSDTSDLIDNLKI